MPEDFSNELLLKKGDVITVLQQNESGWWGGERAGKIGYFPSDFVEIISTTNKIFEIIFYFYKYLRLK